jgi:hypothetical protein
MSRVSFPRLVVLSQHEIDPATHVSRPLLGQRAGSEPDRPWIAVATAHANGGFVLAERAGLTGGDTRELVDRATATLAMCPHTWTVVESRGFLVWKRPGLLRAYGDTLVPVPEMATEGGGVDDLSSDLVLRADVMEAAATLLRSSSMFVAIPKRGWLMVSAGRPGEMPKMQTMHQIADGIAGRGGRHVVSKLVLFYEGAKLTGWSSLSDGAGELSLTVSTDADPWDFS